MNESVAGSTAEVNNHFGVGLIICTEHEVLDVLDYWWLSTTQTLVFLMSVKQWFFLNCWSNCDCCNYLSVRQYAESVIQDIQFYSRYNDYEHLYVCVFIV